LYRERRKLRSLSARRGGNPLMRNDFLTPPFEPICLLENQRVARVIMTLRGTNFATISC
jgi:hypothetical protein